ncbi:histidinol-phosphatase [Lachnospiraceae bacterium KM106-2]|nr:histidinol-phosphatase [Lachnospiraceae bacterium KM106-2]
MIQADYHVHTAFSSDSQASVESMIEQAIALGFTRICITDHMDYDYPKIYDLDFVFQPDEYFTKLEQIQKKYASKIKVLIGIELGLRPSVTAKCKQLVEHYPFDFIIGSTHLVDDIDPYEATYWNDQSEEESIDRYFKTISDNLAAFSDIDVYGHLDYVVRYAPSKACSYEYSAHQQTIDQALQAILAKGKGIEVNTAGYKYGLGFAHPKKDIIKRYLELGGKIITIGSDGHKPEHMAYDFKKAREMLLSLGVKEYTVFEKRQPIFLPL